MKGKGLKNEEMTAHTGGSFYFRSREISRSYKMCEGLGKRRPEKYTSSF
jgi:hypothetical protein